jgi:hypothetical protein
MEHMVVIQALVLAQNQILRVQAALAKQAEEAQEELSNQLYIMP